MENIFEGVQFIGTLNEEYASGGAFIRIANKLGLRKLIAHNLSDKAKSDSKAVKKALYNFSLGFDNVKKFNEAIKSVKDISIKELSKFIKVDLDKDLQGTDAHSCAIFGYDDSVMAYDIRVTNKEFYYKICTNKFTLDKNLDTFIQAVFEDHLHIIGDGLITVLKSWTGDYVKGYRYYKNNDNELPPNNPKEYTQEEFNSILSEMRDIAKDVRNFISNICKKYKCENMFDITDNFNKSFPIAKVLNWSNDGPKFEISWDDIEYDENIDKYNNIIFPILDYITELIEKSKIENELYYNDADGGSSYIFGIKSNYFIILRNR